jgi:tetratricopeptide (TPR) repeat protein
MARCAQPQPKTRVAMPDMMSTLAGTIWAWLNTEQYAGALSALLAVLTLVGSVVIWVWRRKTKADTPPPGGNNVSASNGGVGAGGSMTGNNITTNHGPTPEQIAAIFAGVRDLSPASEAQAAAALYGTLSRAALSSFFVILREQEVPPEQLPAKLAEIAQRHREVLERLDALQLDSPDDPQRLSDARAAIEQGEYDRADQLLATIEEEQAAAHAKAQANANVLARRQAATRAERARLSALRQDYLAAADHFLAAANLLPAGDTGERGNRLVDSADALRRHGDERGDNDALRRAIARYREALPPRDRHPALWGRIQNNLGTALGALGERESGTGRLTEAVEAFRNALRECPQERVPLEWASTQNNLGNALRALGERESGTGLLTEAVDAYRNALRERTQARVPLDWAMTQNNLGSALARLGERESGTGRLTQAVEAFQNALRERTQARVPLDWAMTQNNLGNALQTLGERESGTGRLTQAVEAFQNALRERTQERLPLAWAMTQNNLGNALARLGERESGTGRLTEAVEAYRNALRERTQERLPLAWARTQSNMGNALRLLAERNHDVDSAKQAVAAQDGALTVFHAAEAAYYIEGTTKNLALARATLAKLEGDADDSPPHQ